MGQGGKEFVTTVIIRPAFFHSCVQRLLRLSHQVLFREILRRDVSFQAFDVFRVSFCRLINTRQVQGTDGDRLNNRCKEEYGDG